MDTLAFHAMGSNNLRLGLLSAMTPQAASLQDSQRLNQVRRLLRGLLPNLVVSLRESQVVSLQDSHRLNQVRSLQRSLPHNLVVSLQASLHNFLRASPQASHQDSQVESPQVCPRHNRRVSLPAYLQDNQLISQPQRLQASLRVNPVRFQQEILPLCRTLILLTGVLFVVIPQ